ncbi:PadR family transcriptional regulator [Bowmanella denitrificans]|uniref:PadR family transcriptional regulator n=1 Tax=Bowmanella denitrificans TaxID=366582 RepID=UPI000C9A864B|nr:helix-turn-helix transcriptional regulator [Bowmanella denitrificans]
MAEPGKILGEFEQVTLLALLQLDNCAYGAAIRQLLHSRISRDVALGALYATLERMEKKGLVRSWLGDATPERGGRAKRYFEVTAKGRLALKQCKAALDTMWQGIIICSSGEMVYD